MNGKFMMGSLRFKVRDELFAEVITSVVAVEVFDPILVPMFLDPCFVVFVVLEQSRAMPRQ
jgi:hypothetical protein